MKIGFTVDTNMVWNTGSPQPLMDVLNYYDEYIGDLEKTQNRKTLQLALSEIMIEEYHLQRKERLEAEYETFVKKYNNLKSFLVGEMPKNDIERIISDEREKCRNKYLILPIQYNSERFKKIVRDAIHKNPPFDKSMEGKKTDAGFKDALIWETVLLSSDIDRFDKFYFISGDKAFETGREALSKEFKVHHPNVELIIIVPETDGQRRQNVLERIIDDNNLPQTSTVKLYNKERILRGIKKSTYTPEMTVEIYDAKKRPVPSAIMLDDFTIDDFEIERVTKVKDNNYVVTVSFKTNKYLPISMDDAGIQSEVTGIIQMNYGGDSGISFVDGIVSNIEYYDPTMALSLKGYNQLLDVLQQLSESLKRTATQTYDAINPYSELLKTVYAGSDNALDFLNKKGKNEK